jgi:hypothetical protein
VFFTMEDGRLRVSCEAEFGQNLHEAKKKTSSNLSHPMFSGGEKNSCSAFFYRPLWISTLAEIF